MTVEDSVRPTYKGGTHVRAQGGALEFCGYCGSLRCGCQRLVFRKTSSASGVAQKPATASAAGISGGRK